MGGMGGTMGGASQLPPVLRAAVAPAPPEPVEWHGDDALLVQIARNAQAGCPMRGAEGFNPKNCMCDLHQALRDQRVLDGLAFTPWRWFRETEHRETDPPPLAPKPPTTPTREAR